MVAVSPSGGGGGCCDPGGPHRLRPGPRYGELRSPRPPEEQVARPAPSDIRGVTCPDRASVSRSAPTATLTLCVDAVCRGTAAAPVRSGRVPPTRDGRQYARKDAAAPRC